MASYHFSFRMGFDFFNRRFSERRRATAPITVRFAKTANGFRVARSFFSFSHKENEIETPKCALNGFYETSVAQP